MDFCRYSKSGPKSGNYFQKVGKLKVVPRVTVWGMRVPKSVGDVKDFPFFLLVFFLAGNLGANLPLIKAGANLPLFSF